MARPRIHAEKAKTPFATWLGSELERRKSNQYKLAAAIEVGRSTVNAWFNDARTPSPEICQSISRYLHVPVEEVLIRAGHLPADHKYEQPDMPGWLTAALEGLEEWELRVVESTARGLREARSDPSLAEARRLPGGPASR